MYSLSTSRVDQQDIASCTVSHVRVRLNHFERTRLVLCSGVSATAAWGTIIRTVNMKKAAAAQHEDPTAPAPKPLSNTSTVSGPEMYGFAHPTISRLILELPGAEVRSVF